MAKRPQRKIIDTNLFAKTTPAQQQPADQASIDLDEAPTVSTGIGLRTGELKAIDAIASHLGVSRNALLRWAIRYVILEYRAERLDLGKYVEIPPEPKKNIRMP